MQVHQELPTRPPQRNTVLAIGVFDGVHIGHLYLLQRLKDIASQSGMLSGVLTFINHPRSIITPESEIKYITSTKQRIELLEDTGVDMVLPLTFDEDLSHLRAHEFTTLLQERLGMAGLVMGKNFVMGYQREGKPDTLKAIGAEKGFSTTVIEPIYESMEPVSSTTIREAITNGDVHKASRFLGRFFELRGKVVAGNARGRSMGFPTANLSIHEDRMIPGDGIYATWVHVDGKPYMSATNIGVRPTFRDNERIVEVFILDYSEDIYGSEITVEFVERLRNELRFDTVDDLVAQMHKDVEHTRQILKES